MEYSEWQSAELRAHDEPISELVNNRKMRGSLNERGSGVLLPLLTFSIYLLAVSCGMAYLLLSFLLVSYQVTNPQHYESVRAWLLTPAVVLFNILYMVILWKAWIDTGNGRLGKRLKRLVWLIVPLGLVINFCVSSWVFRNFG